MDSILGFILGNIWIIIGILWLFRKFKVRNSSTPTITRSNSDRNQVVMTNRTDKSNIRPTVPSIGSKYSQKDQCVTEDTNLVGSSLDHSSMESLDNIKNLYKAGMISKKEYREYIDKNC